MSNSAPKAIPIHADIAPRQVGQVLKERGHYAANSVITCPHCATNCKFIEQHTVDYPGARFGKTEKRTQLRVHSAQCPICLCLVIGIVERDGSEDVHRKEHVWPLDIWPDNSPHDLEPEIRLAYDDARKLLPISPMAAAVMARRALQHAIRLKLGITEKTLFAEIAKATGRDELSKTTKESLDHVRQIGNWGAHPSNDQADTIIEVGAEEAVYTIEVIELLFEDLYVKPARHQKMNKRIAEIKKG